MTEQEKLKKLKDLGFTINLIDNNSEKFNEKYEVSRKISSLGRQIVVIDEEANIIGRSLIKLEEPLNEK